MLVEEAPDLDIDDESVDDEDDYHNRPGPSSSRYLRDESDEELGSDDDVDEIHDDTCALFLLSLFPIS